MQWKTAMSRSGPVKSRAFFTSEDKKADAGSMYVDAAEHEMWGLRDTTDLLLSDQPVEDAAVAVSIKLTRTARKLKRQVEFKSDTSTVTLFVRKRSEASKRRILYLGIATASQPASLAVQEPPQAPGTAP